VTIELRTDGARVLIEPAAGGRIHQLVVEMDGHEWPLLRSPEDPADHQSDPLSGGCYPMAPWPNRIRDGTFLWRGEHVRVENGREHALHGLVCDRPWEVVARVGRVVEMRCDLDDRWPWEGYVWQRVELGVGFLAMKMEVRSARQAFPAGCGWHPWFRRDVAGAVDAKVTLPAEHRYELRDKLPTGRLLEVSGEHALDGRPIGGRELDDCYTGFGGPSPTAAIEWDRLRLEIALESVEPHVQVFTPPGAVCIEPQTCAPDAFNLALSGAARVGFAVAAPGRAVSLASRWIWTVTEPE
jgi:aldose 1-epimerase